MPFYTGLSKISANAEAEAARQRTIKGLRALKKALAAHLVKHRIASAAATADIEQTPAGERATVRIATWNLREFGGSKYGARPREALYYIAEIISHFDIVALQEIRADLRALDDLLAILGPDWDHLATDVTEGSAGNSERMVFLFDRRHARFTHIAGELTLPEYRKVTAAFGERVLLSNGLSLTLPPGTQLDAEQPARTKKRKDGRYALDRDVEIAIPPGGTLRLPEGCALTLVKGTVIDRIGKGKIRIAYPPEPITGKEWRLRLPAGSLDDSFRQFARSPYLVSFQAGWLKINLCTVHIYFGDNADAQLMEQRRSEIQALTDQLGARAETEYMADAAKATFTAVLGDFNIMNHDHPTMKALENSGFEVPAALKTIPGSNVERNKAYDQIAFWGPERDRGYIGLKVVGAGVFDYFEHVYRKDEAAVYRPGANDYALWRTYRMSDHLPMWVELQSDFGDAYLAHSAGPTP